MQDDIRKLSLRLMEHERILGSNLSHEFIEYSGSLLLRKMGEYILLRLLSQYSQRLKMSMLLSEKKISRLWLVVRVVHEDST